MTKDELKMRVYEVFTGGPFMDAFDEEIDRLIHSGAIDFEEDIGAALMVLIAAMENTLTRFGPIVSRFEEMLNNLRRI
jgi:hypothetical protein